MISWTVWTNRIGLRNRWRRFESCRGAAGERPIPRSSVCPPTGSFETDGPTAGRSQRPSCRHGGGNSRSRRRVGLGRSCLQTTFRDSHDHRGSPCPVVPNRPTDPAAFGDIRWSGRHKIAVRMNRCSAIARWSRRGGSHRSGQSMMSRPPRMSTEVPRSAQARRNLAVIHAVSSWFARRVKQ